MFSFSNQCALVTGANRGIGQAIALQLAKNGAWVAGTATTAEGAASISKQLKQLKLKGQGFILKLPNMESIKDCMNQLKTLNKAPNILINNAGATCDQLTLRLTPQQWQSVLDINLTGGFYLTQQCLPLMLKKRYGRIINVSSIVGFSGNIGQANYAAAKAGLIGWSKTLAQEVANRSITVNVIAPGFIETNMTNRLPETQRTTLLAQIPVGKIGLPEEVAHAAIFLAARESSYITGHTLHVNGGLRME